MIGNILNITMIVLLLLIMDYRFTGNAFHEISGVAFTVLFIFHNVLNRRWYEGFLKGRQNLRRVLMTFINFLLVATMVTVCITGVLISVTVFASLGIRSGGLFMHDLHQGAAYISLILTAIHLGLHWGMLMAKFKKWLHIDDSSIGWGIMSHSISIVVIAYGVYASFVHHIGSNLLMQHVFAEWGEEPSLWRFLLDYFAIVSSYVGMTYYLLYLPQRKKERC